MSVVVKDLIRLAMGEFSAARAGESLTPDDAEDGLILFNELLDALNADDRAIYAHAFQTFTITPNLQPQTIGPAGATFTVATARPTAIRGGSIWLTGDTIRSPLTMRDRDWWRGQRAPKISVTLPTDLYYEPAWPNGSCFFWGIPSAAYDVELELETLFAQVTLATTLNLPMGYQQALRLTFAELFAAHFGQPVPATLTKNAANARRRVWGLNDQIPNLRTADGGLPTLTARHGYDYQTGMIR